MKILFADPLVDCAHSLAFNTGILLALERIKSDDIQVDYWGDKEINEVSVNNISTNIKKDIDEKENYKKILKYVIENNYNVLILTNLNELQMIKYVHLFLKAKHKKIKIYSFLHFNMIGLRKNLKQRIKNNIFKIIAYTHSGVFVLEHYINEIMKKENPKINFYTIHQPLLKISNSDSSEKMISYIGTDHKAKGFYIFIEALKILDRSLLKSDYKFGIFGKLGNYNFDEIKFENIKLEVNNKFLDKFEYEKAFKRSKYVVLPHTNYFSNSFSGIMLDCISNAVPVIASNILSFRYYFDNFGNCGMLFEKENSDDLAFKIKELLEKNDEELYRVYKKNILRVQEFFSVGAVTDELFNVIKDIR